MKLLSSWLMLQCALLQGLRSRNTDASCFYYGVFGKIGNTSIDNYGATHFMSFDSNSQSA
jgi:hypothetical protein